MLSVRYDKNFNIDNNFEEIISLYSDAKWTSYTSNAASLKSGIKNSIYNEYAFINNELVGLIRAVGDGKTIIYVQDIIVKKKYQRNGIGANFLKNLFSYYTDVRQIILSTDNTEKTKEFYKNVGMIEMKDINITSFILKKP